MSTECKRSSTEIFSSKYRAEISIYRDGQCVGLVFIESDTKHGCDEAVRARINKIIGEEPLPEPTDEPHCMT